MDTLTRRERSERMARIRGSDTKPELLVRRIARTCGYKFRVNVSSLPGKPDLVFPRRKKAIFVHGCFWHGHTCRAGKNRPRSNTDYWRPKLAGNQDRDAKNRAALRKLGWKTLVIWECQLRNPERLTPRIQRFLGD